jgi:hypothetical protein
MAFAMAAKAGQKTTNSSSLEFDVIQVARTINWDSGIVKHTLKNLEWTTGVYTSYKTITLFTFAFVQFI